MNGKLQNLPDNSGSCGLLDQVILRIFEGSATSRVSSSSSSVLSISLLLPEKSSKSLSESSISNMNVTLLLGTGRRGFFAFLRFSNVVVSQTSPRIYIKVS